MLLDARITVDYPRKRALNDVALAVERGEVVGLVGESGSGKSTLALALLRLLDDQRARVRGCIGFEGRDLLRLPTKEMRALRGREIALVLQSPVAALNPVLRIGDHFEEAWRAHRNGKDFLAPACEALALASLDPAAGLLRRYPSQISVGQAQRVLIALAILHRPKLLIADEATSALDPITQAGILDLLARLRRELALSILFISHDLVSVSGLCDRVAVLLHGELVETAETRSFFRQPSHPYSQELVNAALKTRSRLAECLELPSIK